MTRSFRCGVINRSARLHSGFQGVEITAERHRPYSVSQQQPAMPFDAGDANAPDRLTSAAETEPALDSRRQAARRAAHDAVHGAKVRGAISDGHPARSSPKQTA